MCRLMGHGIPDGLFKEQRQGGDDEQGRLLALLPGEQALGWISHLWGLPDILLEGGHQWRIWAPSQKSIRICTKKKKKAGWGEE